MAVRFAYDVKNISIAVSVINKISIAFIVKIKFICFYYFDTFETLLKEMCVCGCVCVWMGEWGWGWGWGGGYHWKTIYYRQADVFIRQNQSVNLNIEKLLKMWIFMSLNVVFSFQLMCPKTIQHTSIQCKIKCTLPADSCSYINCKTDLGHWDGVGFTNESVCIFRYAGR